MPIRHARTLTLLLGGEARSAGELARAVLITPQTASTHLTQLLDAGLVKLRAQGRHRYFSLADADVAHMLEALSMVAERDDVRSRWDTPAYKPLKYARSCYCHLAGELGVQQHDALLAQGVLLKTAEGTLTLSEQASNWLREARETLNKSPSASHPRIGRTTSPKMLAIARYCCAFRLALHPNSRRAASR